MSWLSIIIAGILTYLTRMTMVTLLNRQVLNNKIKLVLGYVPSAVFPAIIFPAIFFNDYGNLIELTDPINSIPTNLKKFNLKIDNTKKILTYTYDTKADKTGITSLLSEIKNQGMVLKDLSTEWIFKKLEINKTKIIFIIKFEFQRLLHQKMAELFFELIENKIPGELEKSGRYNAHLISPLLDEVTHNSKILDAVQSLIGENILVCG